MDNFAASPPLTPRFALALKRCSPSSEECTVVSALMANTKFTKMLTNTSLTQHNLFPIYLDDWLMHDCPQLGRRQKTRRLLRWYFCLLRHQMWRNARAAFKAAGYNQGKKNSVSGFCSHLCLRRPLKSSSPASSCPSLLLLTRRD